MCPDKDTDTAVADAPETPAGPAAPGVPDLPDQEAEVTKPEAQQEPSKEESGAEQDEEVPEEQPGDPLEAFKTQIAEAVEAHPELKGMLASELSLEPQGPAEERAELDRERALRDAQDASRIVEAQYSQGLQYVTSQADVLAQELAGNVKNGAQDLQRSPENADGTARSADLLDSAKLVERMDGNARMAASVGTSYGIQTVSAAMTSAFAAHPGARYLTAEDKKTLQAAGGKPADEWAKTYATVYLDAALRGAPAEQGKKADAKSKRDADIMSRAEKFRASLTTNGKAPRVGGPASQAPRNEQEARNWNAEGKFTTAQLRAFLRSQ
jgi:hypothetical protein